MRNWSDAFMAIVVIMVGVLVATIYLREKPTPEPEPEPSPLPITAPATSGQSLTTETQDYIDQAVEQRIQEKLETYIVEAVQTAIAVGMEQQSQGIRQLYQHIQQLVAFGKRIERAVEAGARELRTGRLQVPEDLEWETEARWSPPERQVILYFYPTSVAVARPMHRQALDLIRAGHTAYRVPTTRQELYRQYTVRTCPKWLVIRDGQVIYRSSRAPRFSPQPQPSPSPPPVSTPSTTRYRGSAPYSYSRSYVLPAYGASGIQCVGCP